MPIPLLDPRSTVDVVSLYDTAIDTAAMGEKIKDYVTHLHTDWLVYKADTAPTIWSLAPLDSAGVRAAEQEGLSAQGDGDNAIYEACFRRGVRRIRNLRGVDDSILVSGQSPHEIEAAVPVQIQRELGGYVWRLSHGAVDRTPPADDSAMEEKPSTPLGEAAEDSVGKLSARVSSGGTGGATARATAAT